MHTQSWCLSLLNQIQHPKKTRGNPASSSCEPSSLEIINQPASPPLQFRPFRSHDLQLVEANHQVGVPGNSLFYSLLCRPPHTTSGHALSQPQDLESLTSMACQITYDNCPGMLKRLMPMGAIPRPALCLCLSFCLPLLHTHKHPRTSFNSSCMGLEDCPVSKRN